MSPSPSASRTRSCVQIRSARAPSIVPVSITRRWASILRPSSSSKRGGWVLIEDRAPGAQCADPSVATTVDDFQLWTVLQPILGRAFPTLKRAARHQGRRCAIASVQPTRRGRARWPPARTHGPCRAPSVSRLRLGSRGVERPSASPGEMKRSSRPVHERERRVRHRPRGRRRHRVRPRRRDADAGHPRDTTTARARACHAGREHAADVARQPPLRRTRDEHDAARGRDPSPHSARRDRAHRRTDEHDPIRPLARASSTAAATSCCSLSPSVDSPSEVPWPRAS